MARRPTIKNSPGTHTAPPGETLREVYSPALKSGFLLSVREVQAGGVDARGAHLIVEVYSADPGVYVRINGRDYAAPR